MRWLLALTLAACAGPQPDECTVIRKRIATVTVPRAQLDRLRTCGPVADEAERQLRACIVASLSDADTLACVQR